MAGDLVPALTPEQIGLLLAQSSLAKRGMISPQAGRMRLPTGINNLTAQGDRPSIEMLGAASPSPAGGGGMRIQANGMMDGGGGMGGNSQFIPMMYLDPLFDPILIVFPQDNIRELNRRQRHYYKYQPYVRSAVDFHTETPLSDFDLRCPRHRDAQDYFNDFKERVNLFDHIINLTRDRWLLGEGFLYGNWDETANEFSSFVQFPPEEVEIHSAYVLPERVYLLRPNRDLDKLQTSMNPADAVLQGLMQQYNPGYAEALRQNKPFILDSNRLIVMQGAMSGYSNRGVSPLMAALKDLLYEDYLNLFRMVFLQRHCLSEDTELLTIDGFKNVADIKVGEMMASFNPETEQLEYQPATETHAYDYDGEMVEYDMEYCQLSVTPEHNMWLKGFVGRNGKERKWEMRHAEDTPIGCRFRAVADWKGIEPVGPIVIEDHEVPIETFLKLAGFYVAEGCCSEGRTVIISQSAKSDAFNAAMRETIGETTVPIRTYQTKAKTALLGPDREYEGIFYKIFSQDVAQYMTEQFGRTSLEKKIPMWIKMLPKKYLKILLDALILGDGSDKVSDGVRKLAYYTSSKQLADDVQEIVLKLGWSSIIREPEASSTIQKHQRYIVNINLPDGRERHLGAFPQLNHRHQIKRVPYKGKVYCPTVPPHHLIFARRNGRVVVTGQSFPLKIFKIGSVERGFIPPTRFYNDFRRLLAQAANDPNFNIVTHPFVTTEIVTGHDKTIALEPLYNLVKTRVLTAMFVSEAVISGEKTPFASGITFMRGLMQKYLTFRNNLSNELNRKVFINLSRMRRFYYPTRAEVDHRVITRRADRLVVPEIGWQKANLMGNQQIMQMLTQLRKDGDAPLKYVLEMFGFDFDDAMEQLNREQGTPADPVWREVRKKFATGDKKAVISDIGKRLLMGEKISDALREDLGKDIKTPDEAAAEKKQEEFKPPEVEGPRGEVEPPMAFRPPEAPAAPGQAAEGPGEAQPRPSSETETTPGAEAV